MIRLTKAKYVQLEHKMLQSRMKFLDHKLKGGWILSKFYSWPHEILRWFTRKINLFSHLKVYKDDQSERQVSFYFYFFITDKFCLLLLFKATLLFFPVGWVKYSFPLPVYLGGRLADSFLNRLLSIVHNVITLFNVQITLFQPFNLIAFYFYFEIPKFKLWVDWIVGWLVLRVGQVMWPRLASNLWWYCHSLPKAVTIPGVPEFYD